MSQARNRAHQGEASAHRARQSGLEGLARTRRRTRSCARRVKHGRVSSASGGSSPHGPWPGYSRTTARSPCSSSCSVITNPWFAPLPSASAADRGTSSVRSGAEPTRTRRQRDRYILRGDLEREQVEFYRLVVGPRKLGQRRGWRSVRQYGRRAGSRLTSSPSCPILWRPRSSSHRDPGAATAKRGRAA
jgi:hypothetical protein